MYGLVSGRGFVLVVCLMGGIPLSRSQPKTRLPDMNCDVTLNAEIQQLKDDVKFIKKRLVKMSSKLNGINDISEKLKDIAEDTHVPALYRNKYKVHPFRSLHGTYEYSHREAVARCQEEGMVIATPQQLQVAWQKGMSFCACGWLSDASNRYPIQYPTPGCGGGTKAGIITCSRSKADVFCFG